jgi:hypothetical protein
MVSCVSDPLVHHGRHFGRTVHAMTNVQALITNGIARMRELADEAEDAGALPVESIYLFNK